MTRHILMMIPLYLLNFSAIRITYKDYKAQTEWNPTKKWNLVGCIVSVFGLFLFIYQDFFME